jgi:putative PIN family toxin of toxin-antitoxin system
VRLVLDTATMVSAIRSDRGASNRLVDLALERRYAMLVSTPLMIEYEAVLTRAEHLTAAGGTAQEISALLDALAIVAEPVHLAFHWRPVLRDADDDMVLETALNGNADAIVTMNVRDFAPALERFGLDILKPGQALKRVEARR